MYFIHYSNTFLINKPITIWHVVEATPYLDQSSIILATTQSSTNKLWICIFFTKTSHCFLLRFISRYTSNRFFLSRYVVWSESTTTGKQLMRHITFVILSVFMNYGLLKLFVDYLNWWAMPSQLLTTTIIVIFSYITQRYISFK